jgi:tRNA U34 2-thiouridine synthase MnmA/TrmU
MQSNNSTLPSWRDQIPVHPACDVFPMLGKDELRQLSEDIEKHGCREKVVIFAEGSGREKVVSLLDGRNRLDAMELAGSEIEAHEGHMFVDGRKVSTLISGIDPYAYAVSANLRRRHLTADQKRELVAKLLKAMPDKSNRETAKKTS